MLGALSLFGLASCASGPAGEMPVGKPNEPPAPNATQWSVRPAVGLDACFAITIMGADPGVLQVSENLDARARLRAALGPEAIAAAETLMQAMTAMGRRATPGPALALVTSAGELESLDGVIKTFTEEGILATGLAGVDGFNTPRAAESRNRLMPIAARAFQALADAGYEADWRANQRPALDAAAIALSAELAEIDIISQHRRYIDRPFDPNVTVYLSELSEPHGIKITGQRFVSSPNYSSLITRRNAVHEMMHRMLDPERPETAHILGRLSDEPLMLAILENADPKFGYTGRAESVRGLVEEGTVQALEAVINENLGQGRDQGAYWRQQDGGMHIYAAAAYALMKQSGFAENGGDALAWLDQQTAAGKLQGKSLRTLSGSVVGEDAVNRWVALQDGPV